MMLILFSFAAASVFALLLFILATIYKPKLLPIIIPFMFACSLLGVGIIPYYYGYAIESRYLDGKEAAVINVIEGNKFIYLTVVVQNEDQPRLVSMSNTKENKEMADQAMQKSKEGIVLIKFGEEQKKGAGAGNGDDEIGYGSSAHIIDLQQSNSMSKPE